MTSSRVLSDSLDRSALPMLPFGLADHTASDSRLPCTFGKEAASSAGSCEPPERCASSTTGAPGYLRLRVPGTRSSCVRSHPERSAAIAYASLLLRSSPSSGATGRERRHQYCSRPGDETTTAVGRGKLAAGFAPSPS